MERRKEARFETRQAVALTWLGDTDVLLEATLVNLSGRGMRLRLDRPLPADAAVRIEIDDTLMLGEVCYCGPSDDGGFAVGVELEQVLRGVSEITAQMAALMESIGGPAASPAAPSAEPVRTIRRRR